MDEKTLIKLLSKRPVNIKYNENEKKVSTFIPNDLV